jgi:hypothetical protein
MTLTIRIVSGRDLNPTMLYRTKRSSMASAVIWYTLFAAAGIMLRQSSIPWYVARDAGLKAWYRQAAKARLGVDQRSTYTLVQFHRLVFSEQMHRGGAEAMSDPVWTPLFEYMQLSGNSQFFSRLPYLFHQRPPVANMGQWLFCLFWDRASIPLEYWSSPAAQRYLLARLGPNAAPTEEGLRLWANRLGLIRAYPSVVTGFDPVSGIPQEGFNASALEFHGIPYEPPGAAAAKSQNIS